MKLCANLALASLGCVCVCVCVCVWACVCVGVCVYLPTCSPAASRRWWRLLCPCSSHTLTPCFIFVFLRLSRLWFPTVSFLSSFGVSTRGFLSLFVTSSIQVIRFRLEPPSSALLWGTSPSIFLSLAVCLHSSSLFFLASFSFSTRFLWYSCRWNKDPPHSTPPHSYRDPVWECLLFSCCKG